MAWHDMHQRAEGKGSCDWTDRQPDSNHSLFSLRRPCLRLVTSRGAMAVLIQSCSIPFFLLLLAHLGLLAAVPLCVCLLRCTSAQGRVWTR